MKKVCLQVTLSKDGVFQDAIPYTGLLEALRTIGIQSQYDKIAKKIREEGCYEHTSDSSVNRLYFRKGVVKTPYKKKQNVG